MHGSMVGIGMMGTACPKGFQKAISTFGLDKVHGRMGDGQGGGVRHGARV